MGLTDLLSRTEETVREWENLEQRSAEELEDLKENLQNEIKVERKEIEDQEHALEEVNALIEDHREIHKALKAFDQEEAKLGDNPDPNDIRRIAEEWWGQVGGTFESDLDDIQQRARELQNIENEDNQLHAKMNDLEQKTKDEVTDVANTVENEVGEVKTIKGEVETLTQKGKNIRNR